MTIAGPSTASSASLSARRAGHALHAVGDRVMLRILRRLDDQRYLVSLREEQRVVSSAVSLVAGSTVRAVVTAVGEKLELRYVDTDTVSTSMQDHVAADEDALAQLAARYFVELQAGQRQAIEDAMQNAADPQLMASGGLFLSKLALPVDAANLQALYAMQRWQASAEAEAAADAGGAQLSELPGLAERMLAALQPECLSARSEDRRGPRELARRLLNEQDEGSVAYRFGVLPLLIGDQLMELDLVHFRERRSVEGTPGLRRLAMTFSTQTLGRVEVLAHALGERLTIAIRTDTAASREALAARAAEVRELVARLGWNVESISYDFDAQLAPAARHVLDHVLNADTLSRLV